MVERRVEVPVPATPARCDQIDDGRIHDRDLLDLSDALGAVLEAYGRRPCVRSGLIEYLRQAAVRQQVRKGRIG